MARGERLSRLSIAFAVFSKVRCSHGISIILSTRFCASNSDCCTRLSISLGFLGNNLGISDAVLIEVGTVLLRLNA